MSFLEQLEKRIQGLLERGFGRNAGAQPLEIRRNILLEIEDKIVPLGDERIFPYSRVVVELQTADEESATIFQAAFVESDRLESDVRRLLEDEDCRFSPHLEVRAEIAAADPNRSLDQLYRIRYEGGASKASPETLSEERARLVVCRGRAARQEYPLVAPTTNIGRLPEVIDADGRVMRRNQIDFLDLEDEINSTVSRVHAHIRVYADRGEFRLIDDGSTFGTFVRRNENDIEVPSRNPRGVQLQPGDEIHLGRACLRFELAP